MKETGLGRMRGWGKRFIEGGWKVRRILGVGNESPRVWDPFILCPHIILEYPGGRGTP